MLFNVMSNMERSQLINMSKEALVDIIYKLMGDMSKMQEDFQKVVNLRLYHFERDANLQYGRRESFEIVGIPQDINDDQLEDEVIDIVKEAKVFVNRQPLKKMDICAVHRLKDKKTTIVRVVNRKFAREAIVNGKNLKGTTRYGENNKIFINNAFCPKFRFLMYVIRNASRNNLISRYRIRNGVPYVQKVAEGEFKQIAHSQDLVNLGLELPERRHRDQ